jgi:hypothetical protein
MIELQGNELVFRFPDVHENAVCRIRFQRTLRIPDDNREYPLSAGLGRFPLAHVRHHADRLPEAWNEHGGVLLPMYQAEAMWIQFANFARYPCAVKIAAGKVNAVTGTPWREALDDSPQDYVVVPGQPWLDGFNVGKDLIRQFVAMPLGDGYTAEEQLTGAAEHGGLQIIVYPMKRERYEAKLKAEAEARESARRMMEINCHLEEAAFQRLTDYKSTQKPRSMGLAPGGLMKQQIYADRHGLDTWDQDKPLRCFVHILNSEQWHAATGQPAPGKPPTADDYANAGMPWFEYYDDRAALDGAKPLAQLDSVAAKGVKLGQKPLTDNGPIKPAVVIPLGQTAGVVHDGLW